MASPLDDDYDPDPPGALAWTASILVVLAFALGLLLYPPMSEAPKTAPADWLLLIGRFHPIILHLPVGALSLLALLELLCMTPAGRRRFEDAAALTLWVGAASAGMAVLAGILLSREGGYEGPNFILHQNMALVGTIGIMLALLLRLGAMGRPKSEMLHAYRVVFAASFGLMGLGAHFGGNMSHGSKFLTEYAPPALRAPMQNMEKWFISLVSKPKAEAAPQAAVAAQGSAPDAAAPKPAPVPAPGPKAPDSSAKPAPMPATVAKDDAKKVFEHLILPIFEAKCNKCHNEDKAKGDLRLDNYEVTMAGGESGKNIVAGKPEESLTMQRLALPLDDDEHMPPEGKEQLTAAEVALLRYWISAGASATLKVSEAQFPAEAKEAVKF